jgi:hypothetical protein
MVSRLPRLSRLRPRQDPTSPRHVHGKPGSTHDGPPGAGRPDHGIRPLAALLAVAQRAEHAAVALRQAVTTSQDQDAAATRSCSRRQPRLPPCATARTETHPPLSRPQRSSMLRSHTRPRTRQRHHQRPRSHCRPTGPARRSGDGVTEQVTKQVARQRTNPNGGHSRSAWTPRTWNEALTVTSPARGECWPEPADDPIIGWNRAPHWSGQAVGGPNARLGHHQGRPLAHPAGRADPSRARPPAGRLQRIEQSRPP